MVSIECHLKLAGCQSLANQILPSSEFYFRGDIVSLYSVQCCVHWKWVSLNPIVRLTQVF